MVREDVDLRALVPVADLLDGQGVKRELPVEKIELGVGRSVEVAEEEGLAGPKTRADPSCGTASFWRPAAGSNRIT